MKRKTTTAFSKALAALGDVYINDAFGAAHRAHASTVGITKFIPASAAGFLLKKEIEYLEGAVENPVRPFVAILGGAKVSGKIGVIENLGKRVDKVIIGGGMAFTFLKAKGMEIGNSLVENDMLDFAKGIEDHALSRGVKFYLPVDCVVAASHEPGAESKIVPVQEIPKGWYALDIGPASVKLFNEAVQNAKTILWNGPMGVFEIDAYARGTLAMAHAIADAYALTIVGGGETATGRASSRRIGEYVVHLDRRRRRVGIARRQTTPGPDRPPGSSRVIASSLSSHPLSTIETPVRRPLIIGNWKMNKTASEAAAFIRDLRERVPASPNADVVLAPPFTALESARNALGPSSWISLGAQNLHWEQHGAFTGEVSAPMLRDLGCRYVIVGHSERRTLFGERDENIHKKVRAALRHGLSPILCVGESLERT